MLKTGNRPRHLRLSADRKLLYVAASDAHRVDVVDVASLKVVDRLDVGPDPEVFDISPDGKTMYVGNEDDAELTFFDMQSRKKVGDGQGRRRARGRAGASRTARSCTSRRKSRT